MEPPHISPAEHKRSRSEHPTGPHEEGAESKAQPAVRGQERQVGQGAGGGTAPPVRESAEQQPAAEGPRTAAASTGGLVGRSVGEAAEKATELGVAPIEAAEAGLDDIVSALSSVNEQVIQPAASTAYWLLVTLPFETAYRTGRIFWTASTTATTLGVQAMRLLVVGSSAPITNLSDAIYRYTLAALQRVNSGADRLVSETPRLIRDTLGSAAGEQGAAVKKEGMPEATDIAKEANQALHRVFHKDEIPEEDAQGTLLVEARLLVWHAWLLIGLQLTALRSTLQVMEGMASWLASAWVQLTLGLLVLAAMAAVAPLAGTAAAVAWSSHFVLKQILSLRTYEESIRSFWAPALHSSVVRTQEVLKPYLIVQPDRAQGAKEEEQVPSGPAETSSTVDVVWGTLERASELGGDGFSRLINTAKSSLTAVLASAESGTARLVPGPKADEERRQAEGADSDLIAAAESADEAWQRASSLAAATTFTVLDAARVLIIAVAQRFMLPLPLWLLAPSNSTQQLVQEQSIGDFNAAAGKGPSQLATASGDRRQQQQQQQQH